MFSMAIVKKMNNKLSVCNKKEYYSIDFNKEHKEISKKSKEISEQFRQDVNRTTLVLRERCEREKINKLLHILTLYLH